MSVQTRSGNLEPVRFDAIHNRIQTICEKANLTNLNSVEITKKTIDRLYNGVTTSELDDFSATICANMGVIDPDYSILAGKICISNLHKNTKQLISEYSFSSITKKINEESSLIHPLYYQKVIENANILDGAIDYSRDYMYDYFGYKTLERSYLLKSNDEIIERPQCMHMRVAVFLNIDKNGYFNLDGCLDLYELLSLHKYTHATPTLFNAGTIRPQLSSCFLLGTEDSIEGIFKTISKCAFISKYAGGIGIHCSNIRASGSIIRTTGGKSSGIIPMLKVYNEVGRYINQGGKRNGSIALYMEPWHGDIEAFLELKKPTGAETERARDLFLALWVPDLFMERVEKDEMWSLMCPDMCPNLQDTYGEDFKKLYNEYEEDPNKIIKRVKARDIWNAILTSQIETGVPYMCYKDAVNRKSNQKNIGTIKSSNLCAEIMEYSDKDEYAVCNLASLNLTKCVKFIDDNPYFDFDELYETSRRATRYLDNVIDINYYPVDETNISNSKNRPIGLGVQGLADVFFQMKYAFESIEAKQLNKMIFETIYHASLTESMELAKIRGAYDTFEGSPASKGILQMDLWLNEVNEVNKVNEASEATEFKSNCNLDWNILKEDIKTFGLRNSLTTAIMPTASTSQILGNYECIEPMNSNVYSRRTLAGNFIVMNKYLVKDLQKINLWDDKMKDEIIKNNGSIQEITSIPDKLKDIYKTVWEIKQRSVVDLAIDRGLFVDQSQSLNIFMATPSYKKLTSCHMYTWKQGLKTGMYYLRSKPAVNAIKFTLSSSESNNSLSEESDSSSENQCDVCSG